MKGITSGELNYTKIKLFLRTVAEELFFINSTLFNHMLFQFQFNSPSTHAGLALVVPAIWPLRQAQRAVCLAMVRLGTLLSLLSITISQVPTANWPAEHSRNNVHHISIMRQ